MGCWRPATRTELHQRLVMIGIFVASAIIWRTVRGRIPVDGIAPGEVDGYGRGFQGWLMLPQITLGLSLLLLFLPRIDPYKTNDTLFTGSCTISARTSGSTVPGRI